MARLAERYGLVAALVLLLSWGPLYAATTDDMDMSAIAPQVFPGVDAVKPVPGQPPAYAAYRLGVLAGYVFSTHAVVGSVGFSGQPIDIVAGLDLEGRITGAMLRHHNEPILVIGVPEDSLHDFVASMAGLDIAQPVSTERQEPILARPDAISGATISSGVIRDALVRAARAVAASRDMLGSGEGNARLDRTSYEKVDWADLLNDGSLVSMHIDRDTIAASMQQHTGVTSTAPGNDQSGRDTFIRLYAGLATMPRVGQNLVGARTFNALTAQFATDDHLLFVGGSGAFSFKGTRYRKTGVFDRLQLVQGIKTIRLTRTGYSNVESLSIDEAPKLRELALFRLPADTGFDPLQDWRLELIVERETAGDGTVALTFPLTYVLPDRYRLEPAGEAGTAVNATAVATELPLWQRNWLQRPVMIAVLVAMLILLTSILIFQNTLVSRPRVYRQVRLWYLGATLVVLGFYGGAQLSVFNVLTFVHALLSGFRWELFLLDPLAFILWSYVAMALLFWGRGVFCGWLCPFGALQELTNQLARRLHIPQVVLPFGLHERLWMIKHVIFLGLVALSLHSMAWAIVGTEVEPFKTVISLKFIRAWPFVVYALLLLAAGLFIERFYCRYLCPLGAALAIPARLRMFDWLKRRFQCGRECHICAHSCTVQAIHPTGEINPNECIYCLACQANYNNDHLCPPLAARRKRLERLRPGPASGAAP